MRSVRSADTGELFVYYFVGLKFCRRLSSRKALLLSHFWKMLSRNAGAGLSTVVSYSSRPFDTTCVIARNIFREEEGKEVYIESCGMNQVVPSLLGVEL